MPNSRRLWSDQPVWIQERGGLDWTADRLWIAGSGGREIDIRPVTGEIRIEGLGATCKTVQTSSGPLDVSIVTAADGRVAAMFTTSACASPSVVRARRTTASGRIGLLSIVSKNANVFTPSAAGDVEQLVLALSKEFGVPDDEIMTSFTGVIGAPLPVDELVASLPGMSDELASSNLPTVAKAILTTDPRPKIVHARVGNVNIVGMVKGAGMIEPRMATMLAYIFTDARMNAAEIEKCFRPAVDRTLNSMTVDSDTSTSDTAAMVATGIKEVPETRRGDVKHAVLGVCTALTRSVMADSEGASKVIEVDVATTIDVATSRALARKVANSPLVKAAVHGFDPNWGRIVMALGKPPHVGGIERIDPAALRISLMGVTVYDRAKSTPFDREVLATMMRDHATIRIAIEIDEPLHHAKVWGCGLSEEYVRFNSVYTT